MTKKRPTVKKSKKKIERDLVTGRRYNKESLLQALHDKTLEISPSALKSFRDFGPRGFIRYYCDPKTPPSTDMILGSAVDCFVLTPDDFDKQFFILDPEERPEPEKTFAAKVNKEWKAKILEDNKDKEVLDKDTMMSIEIIAEQLKVTGNFGFDCFKGKAQAVAEGEYMDYIFKGYMDLYLPDNVIYDLKKVPSARFSDVRWKLEREYITQMASYWWMSDMNCRAEFICFDKNSVTIPVTVSEQKLVAEVSNIKDLFGHLDRAVQEEAWDIGAEFLHGGNFHLF